MLKDTVYPEHALVLTSKLPSQEDLIPELRSFLLFPFPIYWNNNHNPLNFVVYFCTLILPYPSWKYSHNAI